MSSAFEGLPKTPNLKLNKPGYDNVADIEALNENADILDAEIQGIKDTFVKSVNGINAGDGGNVDLGIIPISQGGTGATTASDACANIGALPTSGGTMTGTIAFNKNNLSNSQIFDNSADDNQYEGFYAQAIDKDNVQGASLVLRHALSPKESGNFTLQANKDDNKGLLVGTPSGSLTWVGKEVERVNVTDKSSYIRFESGLQICFSTLIIPANSKGINWTFSAPFKSGGDMLLTATYISPNATCITTFTGRNTTKVTVNCLKVDGYYDFARSVACIAIGWWK